MRVVRLEDKGFGIGVRIVNIKKEDAGKLLLYAVRKCGSPEKDIRRLPLFVWKDTYRGFERRTVPRINIEISIRFSELSVCVSRHSNTKDLSRYGMLFQSNNTLPVGSIIKMNIDLAGEKSSDYINTVVEVVRVEPSGDQTYDIGAKILEIAKEDADKLVSYALKAVLKMDQDQHGPMSVMKTR